MARRRENAYSDPISIRVLHGLDPVRMRPGMYFGDVREPLIKTILLVQFACRAVDAAIGGHPVRLRVTLEGQGVATIEDDGPGIPIEEDGGRWAPQRILTELFGCCHQHAAEVAQFFCAPGIAPSNALCRWVELDTWNGGRSYHQRFERGRAKAPQLGTSSEHGLRFRIALDPRIFPEPFFDAADVERVMTELAFMVPELSVQLFHGRRRTELEELDVERGLTAEQSALLLRAIAIDLDVLVAQHPRVPLAEESTVPRLAIRRLAVMLASIDHNPSTLFRQNIARILAHLKNGNITSLVPYRELWERLAVETYERVMLTDLLACGSPEDAWVEIDRRLGGLL